MKILHLANTHFEFELSQPPLSNELRPGLEKQPLCFQLQFLPLLYADQNEAVAVSSLPNSDYFDSLLSLGLWSNKEDFPELILLMSNEKLEQFQCHSWGMSKQVAQWANQRGINYLLPDWTIIVKVNSKAFSFNHSPKLPGAKLLWTRDDLDSWLKTRLTKSVLKKMLWIFWKRQQTF